MSAFTDLPPFFQGRIALSPGGCWLWTGELNRNGYGTYLTRPVPGQRKRKMVHIEVYVLLKGEYDRRLLLDHGCRVRNCCNPEHLEPVTVKVNTLRGEAVLFKPLSDPALLQMTSEY